MARRRGDDMVTLTLHGEAYDGQLARDFDRAQRRTQDNLNRMMRELDRELPPIFKRAAPKDTRALARSIDSKLLFRGSAIKLSVTADARRRGFNYLPVTRYGHLVPFITARRGKLTVFVGGRRSRGKMILRPKVRGYRPNVDWVEIGTALARPVIVHAERELSRHIDVNFERAARGV